MRSKMRFSKPSIHGFFVGCLVTTVLYILFSSGLTLTWNAPLSATETLKEVEISTSEDSESPAVIRKLYSFNSRSTRTVSQSKAHQSRQSKLFRRLLLPVIATPLISAEVSQYVVNTTWGQNINGWNIAIGTRDTKRTFGRHGNYFLAPECKDFSNGSSMSPEQLFCLLKAIKESFITEYHWFLIVTESVYVSVKPLERLLAKMDPNETYYMGKVDSKDGYCLGGPGILLSQGALNRIVPQLQNCLNWTEGTVRGDQALGSCFDNTLHQSCFKFGKAGHEFFIEDDQNLSVDSNSGWREEHKDFITVYPVVAAYHMKVLHVVDQIRELKYHLNQIKKYEDRLYNSSFCIPQPLKVEVLPPPSMGEVRGWNVVNPTSSYYSHRLEPREWYDGELKLEVESTAQQATVLQRKLHVHNSTYVRVDYGFFRYLGIRGKELILDVEIKNGNGKKEIQRMHVLRPHQSVPLVLEDAGPESMNKMIDFIVPLSNVNSRFAEFMKIYEYLCLRVKENCRLNLVLYGKEDRVTIQSTLKDYQNRYPKAQFNIIYGNGEFSRGRALHLGISTLKPSALAFTCDVDMTIERSFLDRCRRNAIEGRRVYYPEVFKYYNMDYVYRFQEHPKFGYAINRNHGHWCTYGYGMLCIYKSDYDTLGGYNTKIMGWGGEDIQLAEEVISKGLEVMRAPDPALSHRYHPKICSNKLSKDQYYQCVSSRNEDIADRRRLADYIYYLENKCNKQKKVWD